MMNQLDDSQLFCALGFDFDLCLAQILRWEPLPPMELDESV